MIDEDGLLVSFVEESQQHLQTIEPDLLELEQGGDNVDSEVLNRIFRSIHSIKGASGFFGLEQIGKLSHIMENLLSLLRDGKISVTPELTDALLSGVDALRAMVEDVTASEDFDIQDELTTLGELYKKVSSGITAGTQQKVEVKEKPKEEKLPAQVMRFEIDEEELKSLINSGKYLYSVKLFLKEDLEKKNKTPFDYINSIESLGRFVDSFLDISDVTGLHDCTENDIAFNFIFSTVLDPDLIHVGLEVDEERIVHFDLDDVSNIVNAETGQKIDFQSSMVEPEQTDSPASMSVKEAAPEHTVEEKPSRDMADKESPEAPVTEKEDEKAAGKAPVKPARQIQAEEKLRVGVNLLNDLVNLAGELVLGRNQLMEISAPLVKNAAGLNTVLQHVSRVTTEMQEKIMQLRMQPVSVIFGKFHRVVRDLSKNLSKEIVLETYGEDVELDKSIIESLSDPLTHIIRNSADHGIETPDEREKKGKPRQGKIILKAYHEGGQVHLEITDDGKGINTEVVGKKAVERGIITEEQRHSMSERDLQRMILRAGFSTAEQVSSVSGRGVGMDVVVTNIEALGGNVEIDSTLDEGTTMKLILPLTLAIVSGLVIKSLDQTFILPEVNIEEMVRIKPEEIADRIDTVQNAQVLRLREMLVPLINLRTALQTTHKNESSLDHDNGGDPLRILILKYGSSRLGLMVDAVENMEEIVVKPLPTYLKKMKCFSGATIMGNGKVALILDIGGIIDTSALKNIEEKVDYKKAGSEGLAMEEDTQTLLLFDNSTEERFALPLELITRIESVSASQIEHIRDKQFLQYQGENLQMIFLEDYLPINKPVREDSDKIGIIIPKSLKYPMGIVINRVIDTVNSVIELDTSTMMAPGLFGSAVIDKKITLLVDLYKLFEMAAPEWYGGTVTDDIRPKKKDKKRILLVEDTAFFRMVESEYLKSAGYEVVVAEDGNKALSVLDKEQFDAVVLDIMMPGLDGWGVIKALRGDERLKSLPVLAVTSLADDSHVEKGLEAGFDDWEAKLNKTSLLNKLANLINREKQEA